MLFIKNEPAVLDTYIGYLLEKGLVKPFVQQAGAKFSQVGSRLVCTALGLGLLLFFYRTKNEPL